MPTLLNNLDLSKNQLLNALAQLLAADPGAPVEGQFWWDTTNHVWKMRTNSATIILGRLDQISAPTADVSLNSHRITNALDPLNPQELATKNYVDATVLGLDFKGSVRVATTAALPANTYSAGVLTASANGALTVDSIAVALNDRVLVKNEATASRDGIYTVTQVGSGGTPYILTRATDFDSSADANPGSVVAVEEGTVNSDTVWLMTTNAPVTLDTSNLNWSKLGPGATGTTKFAQTIGDGAATSIAVNHNLGTQDVQVSVYQLSDNKVVMADVVYTNTNTVTLTFSVAPASNALRVVVIG